MKIKTIAINFFLVVVFSRCNQTTNKHPAGQMFNKEVLTLYSKTDCTIGVARILTTGNKTYDLLTYELNISMPENARQKFISSQHLTSQQFDSTIKELQNIYNWTPFKPSNVLFLQIQPAEFKNEFNLLDKRQEIETRLTEMFEKNNLGEWFASDLGPGGGNMLFTAHDIDKAVEATLEFLQQNKFEKNVIIGRRVWVMKDDWFYEVIYPSSYSGNFNTM